VTPLQRQRFAPLAASAGFLGGLVLWFVVASAVLAERVAGVAASVLQAREVGLVSFTVLAVYDKSQEALAWLLGCLIVPLATWVLWATLQPAQDPAFRVGRRRRGPRRAEDEDGVGLEEDVAGDDDGERVAPDRRGPPVWFPWAGLGATLAAVALRPGFVRGPSPWGSFGLLGEEGVYLGAIQAMRTGRTLYTDLEFPYGPLMILPLDLWMRLFGDSVAVARSWVLVLHLLGLVGAALVVRWLLGPRTGPWAGLATAMGLAIVAPMFLPNLNGTLLRPVLALMPGAALFAAGRSAWFRRREEQPEPAPWRNPMLGVGALAGVAALFSFEVGPAAAGGLLAAGWVVRPSWKDLAAVATGAVVVGLAVGLPLYSGGALAGVPEQMTRMLTLPALGYQALPYPDALGLFRDVGGSVGRYRPEESATALWSSLPPLAIWFGLAAGLCGPRRGGVPTALGGMLVVAAASAVLFRAALGRSDLYHLWFYGAVPVTCIAALGLGVLWDRLRRDWRPLVPSLAMVAAIGLAAVGSETRVRFPEDEESRLGAAAGIDDPLVPVRVRHGRLGKVRLLPRLAREVDSIVTRAARLPPDDGVWFYPSESLYYFLTGRPLPTRFLWAYDAATTRLQDQAILELEQTRPRWLFRSSDTFPIDQIPQSRLVPRIDSYVKANYRPVEVLPGATLMERIE